MVSLTIWGIKSDMYEGTSKLADLNMKTSLSCLRPSAKELHPHSMYRFSEVTDLVRPVTIQAASFCSRSSAIESC